MTDQHSSSFATQPAPGTDTVVQACGHIDAAAHQLEARPAAMPSLPYSAWLASSP